MGPKLTVRSCEANYYPFRLHFFHLVYIMRFQSKSCWAYQEIMM